MAAKPGAARTKIARERSASLPPQARPAIRGPARSRHGGGVRSSGFLYENCVAACRSKRGPLRSVCEGLCADMYGG